MNRRFFMNEAQPQGFPFIFGHPYFQTANLNDYDQVYEIQEPEANESKDNLANHSANDEQHASEKILDDDNLTKSLSSDQLRIDPNYKWLLKDLNLSNQTRVIDVTDILEGKKDNTETKEENEEIIQSLNEHSVQPEEADEIIDQEDDPVKLFYPNNDQLITHTSLNNTSHDLDDVTINTNNSYLKPEEGYDAFDEDHKNDESCINRLYEKLVKPSYDSDKQNETVENQQSDYENSHDTSMEKSDNEFENDDHVKRRSNFGKSFEASLSSMDNLIDRLDNGMKLKRNKERPKNETEKKMVQSEDSSKIVESLKQEWSNMFSKLEHDYKNKLDEQQKLNDMKLKSLHDEIKKCIIEQEKFINKIPNNNPEKEIKKDENNFQSTITISENLKPVAKVDASTATIDSINPNTFNDNAKYIANLRTELKSKHARHIQDLKDYYEKEIDDLKYRLDLYEERYGTDPNDETEKSKENEIKLKYEQLSEINADLKESNAALIHKLEECNEHISYLKQENYELTSNLGQMNSKLKYAEDRIQALQESYAGLESQLSESIKLQDKYVRELQGEKRNLMKKVQENEDFQMNIKYYEQKCESYELKLDERDTIITRLKAKLTQAETDFNRLEFEYQKLKNSAKSSNLSVSNQQPYIASNAAKENNAPLQLPIKTQNRFSVPNMGESQNQFNQVLISPRKQSPARNLSNQQLTILCNVNTPNNNQYSSSSSSSKSPGLTRSRSPSINKYDIQESKLSSETNKVNQTPQEGLIRFQNHLNQHQKIEKEDLVGAHSSCPTYNRPNSKFNSNISPLQQQAQSQGANGQNFKISELSPEKQIKYIDKLEKEFDFLMKQRQQLDAKLTRLPYKATNPSMHAIRENIEEELNVVEKKIASVKLELRKLNIIKTH